MQVFSHSRLDKFCRCPAAFHESYILKRPEPTTEPLAFGRAVHAVIEMALNAERFDDEFFKIAANAICGMSSLRIERNEVVRLANQPIVSELAELAEIETHFQVPLNPTPFSPEIQGYIDAWKSDGYEASLIDWKTNRKMYDPLDTYQLGLYAGWLSKKTDLPVRGKLAFLRFGEVREHLYTPDDITKAWDWARKTAATIRERVYELQNGGDPKVLFPATPGDACVYCAWAEHCTGVEIQAPDSILDLADAVLLGREILQLEKKVDLMKGRLRGFVGQNGPVTIDGRQFRIAPSKYFKWPQGALKEAVAEMEREGIDPYSILSLTAAGLKKLKWDENKIYSLGASLRSCENFRHVAAK